MRHEIVFGVAVLALAVGTVSAQDRKAQAVTGGRPGVARRLCSRRGTGTACTRGESVLDGLCGWRTTDGHTVGGGFPTSPGSSSSAAWSWPASAA